MLISSSARWPSACVRFMLSEPARSTKLNLDETCCRCHMWPSTPWRSCCRDTVTIAWDRLLCSFMLVAPVARTLQPS